MDFSVFKELMADREFIYFLRQALTILGLFTAGLLPVFIIRKQIPDIREMLFSFPLGLSIYGVSGFLLLISGIGLSVHGIITAYLILLIRLVHKPDNSLNPNKYHMEPILA